MNKEKQIRKQTWKYFRKQKWEEIYDWWDDNGILVWVMMFLIGLALQICWLPFDANSHEPMWAIGGIVGLCMMGVVLLRIILFLIMCVVEWLHGNWKEARAKAEKDFKK